MGELGLRLALVLETHVHADHVTGAGELRTRSGCRVVASQKGASCADVHVSDGDEIRLGGLLFRVVSTPGHTDDSVSYLLGDRVFTGDALLVRSVGRTDFQNGDAGQLYDTVTRIFFALPDDTRVCPGHDYKGHTATTIGEEKKYNARIVGRDRDAFIQLMGSLNLPKPKRIDVAVPANRACGRSALALGRDISPAEVASLSPDARWIDVREPDEFTGPLGHLEGAELVPLGELQAHARDWPRSSTYLLICRSGNRSRKAAELFASMGFAHVHNLTGGMLGVRETGVVPAHPRSLLQ